MSYKKAKQFVSEVESLLTLPEVYLEVKRVVEDPDSCLSDMVNAVSSDPGISAKLMKLVNSAHYNFDKKIDNIRQAVNILGMKPIHDLVLATSLTSSFSKSSKFAEDMLKLWKKSITIAVYSQVLAMKAHIGEAEQLFLQGLLSNIGHQLMYMKMPEKMREIERVSIEKNKPLFIIENERFGFNYAQAGAALLEQWKMPERLVRVINEQVKSEKLTENNKDVVIVHLANILAGERMTEITPKWLQDNIEQELLQLIGHTLEDVQSAVTEVNKELDTIVYTLISYQDAA